MKNTFVHVEVLDKSMNAEYIVAVPVRHAHLFPYIDGYYTMEWTIEAVLNIPGSFIVRKRKFENERIS